MKTPEGWWRARLWVETLTEPPDDPLLEFLAATVMALMDRRRVHEHMLLIRVLGSLTDQSVSDAEKMLLESTFPYLNITDEFAMRRRARNKMLDDFVNAGPMILRRPVKEESDDTTTGARDHDDLRRRENTRKGSLGSRERGGTRGARPDLRGRQ